MKYLLSTILLFTALWDTCSGQYRQSLISVESSVGYSTNTYLNPFFSEWNPSVESGYGVFSLAGQQFWFRNGHSLEATGMAVAEPFLRSLDTSYGALGTVRYRNKFSRRFSGGLEAGVSHLTSSFDRTTGWVQPSLTWFPGAFTSIRLMAGSTLRSYRNDTLGTDSNRRFDLYGVELETWPTYRWHLSTSLHGPLAQLPRIGESMSAGLAVGYLFRKGTEIRLNAGYQQYRQQTATGGGMPGPGFPAGEQMETDRIYRLGISADLPLNRRWSVFLKAERLDLHSTLTGDHTLDANISGGFRFSIEPFRNRGGQIEPEWNTDRNSQDVQIRYRGDGQLYLTGDFNDWKTPGIPLTRISDQLFYVQLNLEPGVYEYKVLAVTGSSEEWVEISSDSYTVSDGYGGKNSLIVIEQ